MASTGEAILFWCIAPLMVLAALGLIFARKAVHATLCVVFVMISLAVLYVAQDAPFLGIVQVVVYTGAVMMLFLFVIMLVGVDASDSLVETIKGQRLAGWLFGLGLGAVLVGVITRVAFPEGVGLAAANAETNPVGLARILFSDFVFNLEVVGILLVTAALAALTLTHKARLTPRVGQKEMADARVLGGKSLVPLPAPGVYAQRNAMDVPALDPHGQPIEASVSRVLRVRGQERGAPLENELPILTELKQSAQTPTGPVRPAMERLVEPLVEPLAEPPVDASVETSAEPQAPLPDREQSPRTTEEER